MEGTLREVGQIGELEWQVLGQRALVELDAEKAAVGEVHFLAVVRERVVERVIHQRCVERTPCRRTVAGV